MKIRKLKQAGILLMAFTMLPAMAKSNKEVAQAQNVASLGGFQVEGLLQPTDMRFAVNSEIIDLSQWPGTEMMVYNDHTFLGLRAAFEATGGTVNWIPFDATDRGKGSIVEATTHDGQRLTMSLVIAGEGQVVSSMSALNGQGVETGPVVIQGDRVYVMNRGLFEQLGFGVEWINDTRVVNIQTNLNLTSDSPTIDRDNWIHYHLQGFALGMHAGRSEINDQNELDRIVMDFVTQSYVPQEYLEYFLDGFFEGHNMVITAIITRTSGFIETTPRGFDIIHYNGAYFVDGHLIVNKTWPLASKWQPPNPQIPITGESHPRGIDREAYAAWRRMQADAAVLGLNIWIQSGFRDYNLQTRLFSNNVARYGRATAEGFSARPGHSEHQTGLAIDLNSITAYFANTPEGRWINSNAHLYG